MASRTCRALSLSTEENRIKHLIRQKREPESVGPGERDSPAARDLEPVEVIGLQRGSVLALDVVFRDFGIQQNVSTGPVIQPEVVRSFVLARLAAGRSDRQRPGAVDPPRSAGYLVAEVAASGSGLPARQQACRSIAAPRAGRPRHRWPTRAPVRRGSQAVPRPAPRRARGRPLRGRKGRQARPCGQPGVPPQRTSHAASSPARHRSPSDKACSSAGAAAARAAATSPLSQAASVQAAAVDVNQIRAPTCCTAATACASRGGASLRSRRKSSRPCTKSRVARSIGGGE